MQDDGIWTAEHAFHGILVAGVDAVADADVSHNFDHDSAWRSGAEQIHLWLVEHTHNVDSIGVAVVAAGSFHKRP